MFGEPSGISWPSVTDIVKVDVRVDVRLDVRADVRLDVRADVRLAVLDVELELLILLRSL
jgi:hypothetical protein